MANFNNRIFGSNIDVNVRNKLKARQSYAENSDGAPLDSIQMQALDNAGNLFNKAGLNVGSFLGEKNFNVEGGGSLFELGSRTPWVRMWTGVQLYHFKDAILKTQRDKVNIDTGNVGGEFSSLGDRFNPAGLALDIQNISNENNLEGAGDSTTFKTSEKSVTSVKTISDAVSEPMESVVYEIGNNEYNLFSSNNPNVSIFQSQKTNKAVSDVVKGASAKKFFYSEGANNDFMKPGAGITSITSTTDGPLGAIRRTTVNFMVHNFYDYENIYHKFFLKPGALVIVDFGWDTSAIYKPENIIKKEGKFLDNLYDDKGPINQSKGDLDVVIGNVTDFESKVNENGSFECRIELTSSNNGLLDSEISDKNGLKNKFVNGIFPYVINKAAHLSGDSFLRKNWAQNNENLEDSKKYAEKFAQSAFSNVSKGLVDIRGLSSKYGVYLQSYDENTGETSGDTNLYISFGFFEDKLLNEELALGYGTEIDFGAKFDSSQTFVSYNKLLVQRQNISPIYSQNKNLLNFLYPSNWDSSYNSNILKKNKVDIRNLTPDEILYSQTFDITSLDSILHERIPLREIFISVELIKDCFSTSNSVNEAINKILNQINEDSYDVFSLKMTSGTKDNSKISIIDDHRTNMEEDRKNSFKNIMTFKPYSKGSIVKSFNLTYSMPKNDHQSMLAIQNTDVSIPLYINDMKEDSNQSIRTIYNVNEDVKNVSFRYLPRLEDNKVKKENTLTKAKYSWELPTSQLLEGNSDDAKNTIKMYESIFNEEEVDENEREELKDDYRKLSGLQVLEDLQEKDTSSDSISDVNLNPNHFYASTLEDYFGLKTRKFYFENQSFSPELPLEIEISIYGIAGIYPGDFFTVDYLPKQYRGKVYFQIKKVTHEVSSEGWSTSFESQMKMIPNKRKVDLYKFPKKIYMNPSWFTSRLTPKISKMLGEFDLTDKGSANVLVFSSKSKYNASNPHSYDPIADDDTGFTFSFRTDFLSNAKVGGVSIRAGGLSMHALASKSIHNTKGKPPILPDKVYYVVVFNNGALVLEDFDDNYLQVIESVLVDSSTLSKYSD